MPVLAPGTGASLWSPFTDMGRVFGWWDASDTSTLIYSGSSVSKWLDKSERGNHLAQDGVAAVPKTGTRAIGNRNALDFDASAAQRLLKTFTVGSVGATVVIHGVVQHDLTGQTNAQWFANSPNTAFNSPTIYQASGNWNFFAGFNVASTTAVDTKPHVVTGYFNNTLSKLFLDGLQIASGTTGTGIIRGASLGASPNSTYFAFDGLIGECIIEVVQDNREIFSRIGYLANKWQIPLTVGGTNPGPLVFQ